MYIDKEYVRAIKANKDTGQLPEDPDLVRYTKEIIESYIREYGDYNNQEVMNITWPEIIFMVYRLNVVWYIKDGKHCCNKLNEEYSLQTWLYCYMYNNREEIANIVSDYMYDAVFVKLEEMCDENSYNISMRLGLNDSVARDVIINYDTNNNNSHSDKKVLWVSRHLLQQNQIECIKKDIFCKGQLNIYHYPHRICDLDVRMIADLAINYDIDAVFVILDEMSIVMLKMLLKDTRIKVFIQSDYVKKDDTLVYKIDESGNCDNHPDILYQFNGWSEVTGAQLLCSK